MSRFCDPNNATIEELRWSKLAQVDVRWDHPAMDDIRRGLVQSLRDTLDHPIDWLILRHEDPVISILPQQDPLDSTATYRLECRMTVLR